MARLGLFLPCETGEARRFFLLQGWFVRAGRLTRKGRQSAQDRHFPVTTAQNGCTTVSATQRQECGRGGWGYRLGTTAVSTRCAAGNGGHENARWLCASRKGQQPRPPTVGLGQARPRWPCLNVREAGAGNTVPRAWAGTSRSSSAPAAVSFGKAVRAPTRPLLFHTALFFFFPSLGGRGNARERQTLLRHTARVTRSSHTHAVEPGGRGRAVHERAQHHQRSGADRQCEEPPYHPAPAPTARGGRLASAVAQWGVQSAVRPATGEWDERG